MRWKRGVKEAKIFIKKKKEKKVVVFLYPSLFGFELLNHIPLKSFPVVLSMWPCKNVFTSKFGLFSLFRTPPKKLKRGPYICRALLIANHLDQSLWSTNQKYWTEVTSYLVFTFTCTSLCSAIYDATANLRNYAKPKTVLFSQTGIFWHFFIQFYCALLHT